jgi:hypothetical protein
MISPKLSILMVAMSVVGAVSPMAAMAQDTATNALDVSNIAAQAADTSADDNVQPNNAEVSQSQSVEAECEGEECESGDASAEDLTQVSDIDQANEIRTGNVNQDQREINQENEIANIRICSLSEVSVDAVASPEELGCLDPRL